MGVESLGQQGVLPLLALALDNEYMTTPKFVDLGVYQERTERKEECKELLLLVARLCQLGMMMDLLAKVFLLQMDLARDNEYKAKPKFVVLPQFGLALDNKFMTLLKFVVFGVYQERKERRVQEEEREQLLPVARLLVLG